MEEKTDTTDIFLWANNTDGIKNELDVEFFLFNKNYTPYSTSFASDLNAQIKPLFLYDLINFVNLGAGTGLSVRDFELSEGEDNVLLRTDLEKVGRAETLLHLIEKERHDIVAAPPGRFSKFSGAEKSVAGAATCRTRSRSAGLKSERVPLSLPIARPEMRVMTRIAVRRLCMSVAPPRSRPCRNTISRTGIRASAAAAETFG